MTWLEKRMCSPEEYLTMVFRLGMTQTVAGRFLGKSPRTVRRYARGETEVPPAEVLLLRALIKMGAKPKDPKKRKR